MAQDHSHSHAPQNFGVAFAAAAGLNIAFVIVQAIYGVLANSMALIADAGHNFGDVIGLLLAWAAYAIARRPATARYTYGFRSATILAALANAVLLLVATGAIAWEAVRRFSEPGEVAGFTVMAVAAVGILVNAGSALLLASGRKGDLNIRGAFLHLIADAAVSAGVVVTGARDPAHRMGVARSAGEPRDLRRHRMEHMGIAARVAHTVACRGAAGDRSGRGAATISPPCPASPMSIICTSGRSARPRRR